MIHPAVVVAHDPTMTGDHGQRARRVIAALSEETEVIAARSPGDYEPADAWAGVLFNSPLDMDQMVRLRENGRPVVYCPGFGPVIEGQFTDNALHCPHHRTDTRLKMQRASVVQVDSFQQAEAAQHFYGTPGPWLVLPAAVDAPPDTGVQMAIPELWVVGDADVPVTADWQERHPGIEVKGHTADEAAQRISLGERPAAVLWVAQDLYASRLLEVAAAGVPLAARDLGLVDDPMDGIAEWFPSDGDGAMACLDRALARPDGVLRAQANAAMAMSWEAWARAVIATLRRLRVSPVAERILPLPDPAYQLPPKPAP